MYSLKRVVNTLNPWEHLTDNVITGVTFVAIVAVSKIRKPIDEFVDKILAPTYGVGPLVIGAIMIWFGKELQSGVNDITDIVGGVLIATGVYIVLRALITLILDGLKIKIKLGDQYLAVVDSGGTKSLALVKEPEKATEAEVVVG